MNAIRPGWHLDAHTMFWSGMAALAYATATCSYLTAMSKTDASYVLGATACYPVISVALSTIFLGESIIIWRVLGAVIVFLGVLIMSIPERGTAAPKEKIAKLVIACMVVATIAWAAWGVIDKQAVSAADPLEVCLGKYLWDILILPVVWLWFRKQNHKIEIFSKRNLSYGCLSAVTLAIGTWCYLSAMSHYCASYVISITACYPVLMYVLAIIFLKERFSQVRSVGIALVVVGGLVVQTTHSGSGTAKSAMTALQTVKTPTPLSGKRS